MRILLSILDHGPQSQTQLYGKLSISVGTIHSSLLRLVELGWLETQEIDKGPGRFNAIEYSLTPAGREIAKLLVPVDAKIREISGHHGGLQ